LGHCALSAASEIATFGSLFFDGQKQKAFADKDCFRCFSLRRTIKKTGENLVTLTNKGMRGFFASKALKRGEKNGKGRAS